MSWSRIIRFSRERQVPVIVTDELGEHPMVLLSLEQLEAALDGRVATPEPIWPDQNESVQSPEPVIVEENAPNFVDHANKTFTTQEPATLETETEPITSEVGWTAPAEMEELNAQPATRLDELEIQAMPQPAQSEPEPESKLEEEQEKTEGGVVTITEPTRISSDLSLEERFYLEN